MKPSRFCPLIPLLLLGAAYTSTAQKPSSGNYVIVRAQCSNLNHVPSSQAAFSFQWGGASLTASDGTAIPLMLEDTVAHVVTLRGVTMDNILCSYSRPFTFTPRHRALGLGTMTSFSVAPIGEHDNYGTRHQGAAWVRVDIVDPVSGETIVQIGSMEMLARHGERLDTTINKPYTVDLRQHREQLQAYYGKPVQLRAFLMASPYLLTGSGSEANGSQSVTVMDDPDVPDRQPPRFK